MNILVVQDDPLARKMLVFLLESEGFKVITAESIRAARAALHKEAPWLIMLDVALPDGDGFTFCRELSETEPYLPIIIISSRSTLADKIMGFRVGADDYITRPFEHSELLERVKAVLRRTSRIQPHMAQEKFHIGDLELNVSELKAHIGKHRVISLTPTEMKILTCLIVNAGRVLQRSQIAEVALGYDYENASNVIDVYIGRLRKKLEANSGGQKYIETVVGSGYRMYKPPTPAPMQLKQA
jgi:DNA-binding response OmpR family regulator